MGTEEKLISVTKFYVLMALDYSIQAFDPNTASSELIDKYIEFQQTVYKYENPDDPVPPREVREKNLFNPNPMADFYRWVVLDDEENVLAVANLSLMNEKSPDYEKNKDTAMANANVLPEFRENGIGTELSKTVANKMLEINKKFIIVSTSQEEGEKFLLKYGAKLALEGAENRLYMKDVDWDMIEQWAEEGPKRAPGVRMINFTDVPDELIEDYVEIYSETMNQQPLGDIDMEIKVTPESRRQQEELFKIRGYEWVTKATLEEDGKISGLTEIFINPKMTHRIDQNLTGVREEYRGKGLGKWLKSEMLLDIRRTFPELKYISTGNADTNAPMLSINQRMGFKKYKSGNAYKAEIKDFAEKLGL